MITLLEKYHAYAPPFKYEPPLGGQAYIGGIDGRIEWDTDLANRLKKAWEEAHTKLVTKEYKIKSAHKVGVVYTVRRMLTGWVCTCPARVECWHIKYARTIDAVQDETDAPQRCNDYSGDI
jgi:hypothetical protein